MTTYSQNGYKAGDTSLITKYIITRDITISLRKGNVAVVLLHFARWFDKNIQPLTKADTGGYNFRKIAGSSTVSNHGSGTAMDLRWNLHVRGKKNTFTAAQAKKIRTQLKFYGGVIRWGGDYKTGIIDEMHFEINKGLTDVDKAAKKCLAKPAAPSRVEVLHVNGELNANTIQKWQEIMKTPADGKISKPSDLVTAVQKKLQSTVDHRLVVDGLFGPKTYGRLATYLGTPVTQKLDSNLVKALQRRLNENRF